MVTERDVFRLLSDFGIRHSDKITVHSALRAAGEIEGEEVETIQALRERADYALCAGDKEIPEDYYI